MLWKLPDRKVFLDGRMVYWKQTSPSKGESSDAFAEHGDLMFGNVDTKAILAQYHVNSALLAKKDDAFGVVQTMRQRLMSLGWVVAYEDDISVLYVRSSRKP